ncbi:MAG TPA: decaprenylphospho-beta-D-erythro-pentofuranosid-2-ulose 2-reductase [Acidimicrobiia bacterium]|nr:decaprenylphospho-beta-D-erythro-pentofuranosid-2-ulose 2-reductase [Acidimicrobiia bacterium]
MNNALGNVQSVLVLGGGSDLARAIVRELGGRLRTVVLAGRDPGSMAPAVAALRATGIETVEAVEFDATAFETHDGLVAELFLRFGDFDVVLLAFGVLGDAETAARDGRAAVEIVETNFTGAVSVLVPVAQHLRSQGHGAIVVLSSVAGERVRKSNFVYGASKAGLDGFAQGLADSLHGSGVRVLIVRPGFVHTKMTQGRDAAPLSTTPEVVARAVVDGLRRGRTVVWAPAPLRYVMAALRHLPRAVFRRLPL